MLKLCMKILRYATKVLLFCFEVKSNSNVILRRDIIQHGNVEAAEAASCCKLAKKILTLDEKIKFLDLTKKNPKLGCRELADF